jgi:cysteine desulfurase
VTHYLFFDSASTTKCEEEVIQLIRQYADEDFGNPSSSHAFGQRAARVIREARHFFAKYFRVLPEQVIFTGSGTEANNLAIYGTALNAIRRHTEPISVLYSAIEHPSVRKTAESLQDFGVNARSIPVDSMGQIVESHFEDLLTPQTLFASIHRVNNIVGAQLPVEELAKKAKAKAPHIIFHTDAVQAFGRVSVPRHPSAVDLISISGHKIGGPKGVGALIVLNKKLLQNLPSKGIPQSILRPLLWGGDQEHGLRSGTQNAGLIAGFHRAAEITLAERDQNERHFQGLRTLFREKLQEKGLMRIDSTQSHQEGQVEWNSPADAVPHIISLSVPGFPSGPLANLLEERHCLVSVGSACSSKKPEPEPILGAMGKQLNIQTSGIRISFSKYTRPQDIESLAIALHDSIRVIGQLQGTRNRTKSREKSRER